MLRPIQVFACLMAAALLAGCQMISTSVESASDSIGGLSDSISRSSDGLSGSSGSSSDEKSDAAAARYQEDVRIATRGFVGADTSERSAASFLRELGGIAERHGISHWEARPETLYGIGSGARQAGLSERALDALLARLGQGGESQRALAREGWRSATL